ncbi:MAG: hypothetical protein HRU20_10155 [Pseudomonadales bacterium]|nr:hypothetical protein [Pseudomonadales bacterium]
MRINSRDFLLILATSFTVQAESVGKKLSALSFEAQPEHFHYAPNGKVQLITIYPAKPSSMANGDFNQRVQQQGICPLSITDIDNKAWYAPVSMVESEMRTQVESEKNILGCQVAGDYDGKAVKQWKLKKEAVTIVVDGNGEILFIEYGVLNDRQEQQVLDLLG